MNNISCYVIGQDFPSGENYYLQSWEKPIDPVKGAMCKFLPSLHNHSSLVVGSIKSSFDPISITFPLVNLECLLSLHNPSLS